MAETLLYAGFGDHFPEKVLRNVAPQKAKQILLLFDQFLLELVMWLSHQV